MFKKNNHPSRRFNPKRALFMGAIFIAFILAVSWVVMFLWNAILPDTIGVKPLTYWKAVGLLVLFKILFGGFGGRRNRRKRWKDKWDRKWKEKWMNMNEEEKERFKSRWKEHCRKRGRNGE